MQNGVKIEYISGWSRWPLLWSGVKNGSRDMIISLESLGIYVDCNCSKLVLFTLVLLLIES